MTSVSEFDIKQTSVGSSSHECIQSSLASKEWAVLSLDQIFIFSFLPE